MTLYTLMAIQKKKTTEVLLPNYFLSSFLLVREITFDFIIAHSLFFVECRRTQARFVIENLMSIIISIRTNLVLVWQYIFNAFFAKLGNYNDNFVMQSLKIVHFNQEYLKENKYFENHIAIFNISSHSLFINIYFNICTRKIHLHAKYNSILNHLR